MQRLPDFLMLDFCEWIKRVILSKAQYSNIDMWDLLFDEKYEKLLLKKAYRNIDKKKILLKKKNKKIIKKKAKEYCNKERKQKNAYSNDNIKKIINESIRMYYESDEFQDLCYSIRRLKEHYSRDYLFHEFQRSFTHFGYFLINEMPRYFNEINDYDEQHLSPYTLIDNLRYCYKDSLRNDQEKNPILELMVGSKAVEIEFLEWIEQEKACFFEGCC